VGILAQKADFEKKYVGLDVKGGSSTPFDDSIKLVESEMKALKGMAMTMFGNRAVKFPMSYALSVVNTGANTNQAVITLDASLGNEFNGASLVFDEMRTFKVRVVHFPTSNISSSTSVGAAGGMAVMLIDAIDQVPCASVGAGTQSSFHKLYHISTLYLGSRTDCVIAQNNMHSLDYTVPPGPISNNSASGTLTLTVGNQWVDTLGTPGAIDIVGFLKFYEVNTTNSAVAVGTAAFYFDCEWRLRE